MAARRSSSRSNGGRSRRAPQSNNTGMFVGIGAVVAIVAIVAIVMSSGGGKPAPQPQPEPAVQPQPEVKKPDPVKEVTPASSSSNKNLKDPDRPAPSIPSSLISTLDETYSKAQKLHDDARRAQAAGDSAKFNQLINDSWDTLLHLEQSIETYTLWLEEANMEDWKVPGSYAGLQARLTKIDKLKGGIKRIKPDRR